MPTPPEAERWANNEQHIWRVVGKSWADEDFKRALIESPEQVLTDEGFQLPEGATVKVLEDTPEVHYLVIPLKPSGIEVLDLEDSEEQICWCCL